jgi:hypothetical protein
MRRLPSLPTWKTAVLLRHPQRVGTHATHRRDAADRRPGGSGRSPRRRSCTSGSAPSWIRWIPRSPACWGAG